MPRHYPESECRVLVADAAAGVAIHARESGDRVRRRVSARVELEVLPGSGARRRVIGQDGRPVGWVDATALGDLCSPDAPPPAAPVGALVDAAARFRRRAAVPGYGRWVLVVDLAYTALAAEALPRWTVRSAEGPIADATATVRAERAVCLASAVPEGDGWRFEALAGWCHREQPQWLVGPAPWETSTP